MRILILGGTGFIGRHVALSFLESGHEIAVFHRGERAVNFPSRVVHLRGDRERLHEYTRAFTDFSPQAVVDLIAFTEADAQSTMDVFAGKAERLVCASSMDVYQAYGAFLRLETSTPSSRPLAEDAPLRTTLFPYRALAREKNDRWFNYEKILVERMVMNNDRLPAVVLRLPQVFGPHDGQHRLRNYLRLMDANDEITVSRAKARWRWTRGYVEDVAVGFVLAATHPLALGRIYNIGEKVAESELDWLRRIGQAAGWRGQAKIVPDEALPKELAEPYDWRHDLAADTRLIRQELGYAEKVSPKKAMERTVSWERSAS